MRHLPCSSRCGWAIPLLALLTIPASAAKPADPGARFKPTAVSGPIVPVVKPAIMDGDRQVEVIVRVAGDSVAAARANAPDRVLAPADREGIEKRLQAKHEALAPLIRAHGGKVLAHYRSAINGLKIQVARSQIPTLRSLPEVVSVTPVRNYKRENATSVPFIGAPAAWAGTPGFRGEHVKVAIIDTGIDYTHANFGGPGTPDAYSAAFAQGTSPADPALFGPSAPKVKGGIDLVGDNYDSSSDDSAKNTPVPDPNPLDCNGHGSHVAGTTAGFGVSADGTRYQGPYDASTYTHSFRIGPGVAPLADLYAVRVFGCDGTTGMVVDAVDWAVANDMDVINLSLGSPFGDASDPDVEALQNAARSGIVVVASAGNEGPAPYMVGAPGAAAGAISVAAMNGSATFPGAKLTLDNGTTITALDANGAAFVDGVTLPIYVLTDPATGDVSLGCSESEYVDADIAGKLVVTARGVCARIDRATFGARHGAAAVAMINNAVDYPPFENVIDGVSIPFLGVLASDATALISATQASLSPTTIPNPDFGLVADFSSGGPRYGDSLLKPNVAAPGVGVYSTAVGTGNSGATYSGTSMASPHVTGVAALTVQAHRRWDPGEIRAAITNTANPDLIPGYAARLVGTGVVQPAFSTLTDVVAFGRDERDADAPTLGLSFGFAELRFGFVGVRPLVVRNKGKTGAFFDVSTAPTGGVPHLLTLARSSVYVGPGQEAVVPVILQVPAATVGDSSDFREVAGVVTLTPRGNSNHKVALRVPYYLVPRARSDVRTVVLGKLSPAHPTAEAKLVNLFSPLSGIAETYSWGLFSQPQGTGALDLRAAGVQSFDYQGTKLLVFAINGYERWSNPDRFEFDVLIDVNGDNNADYAVIGIDLGLLTAGEVNGQLASFILDFAAGTVTPRFLAVAPTDGSTIELPALASDLGLSADQPRFSYSVKAYDIVSSAQGALTEGALYNAWTSSVSQGASIEVASNASASLQLSIDPKEWALTPSHGIMVVTLDNASGDPQAKLIPVR